MSSTISVKVEIIEKETVKIYRMSTLDLQNRPIMWVSAYLIDGLLIDCGHHHAKDAFLKELNIKAVEKCVLSHHHEDHFGACFELINTHRIPVYATKETAFLIRTKIRIPPERMLVWGMPRSFIASELPNVEEITTKNASFKIIPSPGHCKNLLSFYHQKKRFLFSTDAFIDKNQSVIFNWENAPKMLDTFERLKALNPKYIFLENGNVATADDLSELIKSWNKLRIQSQELYNKGVVPKYIMKEIFGKESYLKDLTSGDMSRENLIRSLLNLPSIYKNRFRK